MRDVKFIIEDNAYNNDDIQYAFECNGLKNRLKDIDVIVAEVCGENDSYGWYWILQMKDKSFSWAYGWCDYTGWDCQSGAEIHDGFVSPVDAIDAIKEDTMTNDRKNIKDVLAKQITGEIPFAVYQEQLPN